MKFTNLLKSLILETSRFRMLYDTNVEVEGQKDYYQMIGLKKGANQKAKQDYLMVSQIAKRET